MNNAADDGEGAGAGDAGDGAAVARRGSSVHTYEWKPAATEATPMLSSGGGGGGQRARYVSPTKRFDSVGRIYDSLDYEETESTVELAFKNRITESQEYVKDVTKWALMIIIGFSTALIAFLIDISIEAMADKKFGVLGRYLDGCASAAPRHPPAHTHTRTPVPPSQSPPRPPAHARGR